MNGRARKTRKNATSQVQRRANNRYAKRRITQLVHRNFEESGLCLTLAFAPNRWSGSPPTGEARKMLAAFFKAVRRERKWKG